MNVSLSDGISVPALRRFLRNTAADGMRLRAFRLYRKGETASVTFPPYTPEDRMHVYSLSKSFTSLCVGIAWDKGLLSPDERMVDLFPDKLPETVSDRLAAMTLGDVLSMRSGHSACPLGLMRFSDDPIRTFLALPVVYEPGTVFVYSSGGTCACGAAVERRSGMKLNDFMTEYLLAPLGIEKPRVLTCADGTHAGGIGIFLEPDALFRTGMLLLRGGVYGGKRVVSEEYCRLATSRIADTGGNGTPDWTAGYGYQFWRNVRGGFRCDGAFGQLCVVLPEEDTVFAVQAETDSMQRELDRIYELLDEVLGEERSNAEELEKDVREYNAIPPCGAEIEKEVLLESNPTQVGKVSLKTGDGRLQVTFFAPYGEQTLLAGDGEWLESRPMLRFCNPSIRSIDPHAGWIETLNVRSCFTVENGDVVVKCLHTDTPHTQTFRFEKDALRVTAWPGDLPEGIGVIPFRKEENA